MHWGTLTQVIWKGITHLHFPVIARYCDVVPDSYELYFNDSSNVLHFTSRTFKLTPESLLSKAGHIILILCASKLTTSSACMSVFCYYSSIVYTETDAFPLVALCFGIYSITGSLWWDELPEDHMDGCQYHTVGLPSQISQLQTASWPDRFHTDKQRPQIHSDSQTQIKRTEQANKHQKGTRLKK